MSELFFACNGKTPALLNINGHALLVLSAERDLIAERLKLFGADKIRRLKLGETEEEEHQALAKLARRSNAGLVIAPTEEHFEEMMRSLESSLPWIQ